MPGGDVRSVLGIVLGGAAGPERQRAETVAASLDGAGLPAACTATVEGALDLGATALLLADPAVGRVPGFDGPASGWLTREVLDGNWSCTGDLDTLLVPSTDAARASMAHGIARSRVRVVPHPLAGGIGPLLRDDVVEGVVGLIATDRSREAIVMALRRSPWVRDVIALPRLPGLADGSFWDGPGRAFDRCAVIALAVSPVSGRLPATLLARGAPLVAVDTGASSDAIVHGVCGWLVAPRIDALVRGVESALRDRWARETAGIAGRDRASARHDPATVAGLAWSAAVSPEAVRVGRPSAPIGCADGAAAGRP